MRYCLSYPCLLVTTLGVASFATAQATAQQTTEQAAQQHLSDEERQQIEKSIDRGLKWLAANQQPDGSFPSRAHGQPGVTSLCVMAFAAHGHLPDQSKPYGSQLQQAIEFILSCQKPNGLVALVAPVGQDVSRKVPLQTGSTAVYNHALSALVLSETFSMSGGDTEKQREAIERAVRATLQMQSWQKPVPANQGGWRYLTYRSGRPDSDLSITGWQVMFLRSAKNAGFDVPRKAIDDAVAYIRRCFRPKYGTFTMLANDDDRRSRGMAGAGILAMAHAGLHNTMEAKRSGDWLLEEGFPVYNESRYYTRPGLTDDRYHYGVFCASQAMQQLGDEYWQQFFPPVARVILRNQETDGSWAVDSHYMDRMYGNAYTTALMVLTLGASNQLLPIFQR